MLTVPVCFFFNVQYIKVGLPCSDVPLLSATLDYDDRCWLSQYDVSQDVYSLRLNDVQSDGSFYLIELAS